MTEGIFCRGFQACVGIDDSVILTLVLGESTPPTRMTSSTLHNVWCATKPMVALALGHLVDDGLLDVDAPIRALVDQLPPSAMGEVTVRHLLNHTAGIIRPTAVDIRMTTRSRRRKMVLEAEAEPGWRVGQDAGYSEYMAWKLLSRGSSRT